MTCDCFIMEGVYGGSWLQQFSGQLSESNMCEHVKWRFWRQVWMAKPHACLHENCYISYIWRQVGVTLYINLLTNHSSNTIVVVHIADVHISMHIRMGLRMGPCVVYGSKKSYAAMANCRLLVVVLPHDWVCCQMQAARCSCLSQQLSLSMGAVLWWRYHVFM